MKILTINRNYFVTGGPENYMFSLIQHLPQHEFIPFCVKFKKNLPSPYERYFVDPPAGDDRVYFTDYHLSGHKKLFYAFRSIYSFEARRKLEALIRETRPDMALFLNAVYFTDSIVDACSKYGVPIISRMSDFHKVCASYLLYRDGKICEECLTKGLSAALRHRCGGYQRSLSAALVKVSAMWLARYRRSHDYVSCFITPTAFTREKMILGGFDPSKVVHIPTFVDIGSGQPPTVRKLRGILFVGRLSPEKGVEHTLRAFSHLRNRDAILYLAGDTGSAYARGLMASVDGSVRDRVVFLGFQTKENLARLYEENLLFVVPSLWYENLPNVLLEGMAHGLPAVAPQLGCFPEFVKNGVTGFLYKPGDPLDLAQKIDWLLEHPHDAAAIGARARQYVREHHSADAHLAQLLALFEKYR